MEFKGFKIDFTALAALLSAIAAIYSAFKGREKLRHKRQEDDHEKGE